MEQTYRIVPMGTGVLLVSFGNTLTASVHVRVIQLFHRLQPLPFIQDVVPAYSSLAVYFDVYGLGKTTPSANAYMEALLHSLLKENGPQEPIAGREMAIPVCYEKRYAPDLEELAQQHHFTTEEVVQLHTAKSYRVYMIGFLPGFPYMGTVDERIATPRRSSPRTQIAAGSVGIAGVQTGIYPLSSPGGWNIIGRTPLSLFDATNENPVRLQPGDTVRFYPITEHEFKNHQGRLA